MSVRINYKAEGEGPPHDAVTVVDGPVEVKLPPASSMSYGTIIRHGETGSLFIRGLENEHREYTENGDPIWYSIGPVAAWSKSHPSLHIAAVWFAWLSIIAGIIAIGVGT